ncbi:glycine receptor subunit alpha-2-like [Littorina saxatilis]|uniref:glycine receptor subunit alpha-2-like n=1 Tax=Littorina saxatilis TaxID=31220 RepID=UPI0038B4D83E
MLTRILCIVCFITWVWNRQGFAKGANSSGTLKDIIDNLLDNGSYDHTIRPLYDCDEALRLEVDVVLNTLGPVIEREMQMTTSFYLRQQWRDPRLAFHAAGNQTILLSHRRLQSLWLPDIYFSASKNEKNHDITVPNVLIRLHPDGTILFSQRLTVTFQCLMDLRNFPLDRQTCYIRMESYSYTTDDMYFAWSSERKSMDILENAHIPDFELTGITTHDCTAEYATGTFPCLEARLMLHRQIGFYMTQTYIPCILIVSLSWVSFWLDTQAIPARISVGLLTVLTITTQSSGVRSELPRVPYTKSIDVWMSVCLVFVFAAYMQYAFVTVFSRRHRKSKGLALYSDIHPIDGRTPTLNTILRSANSLARNSTDSSLQNGHAANGSVLNGRTTNGKMSSLRRSASASTLRRRSSVFQLDHESRDLGRVVDKWSRVAFPLAFLAFNVGYWLHYTRRLYI